MMKIKLLSGSLLIVVTIATSTIQADTTLVLNNPNASFVDVSSPIADSTLAAVGAGSWKANGSTKSTIYMTPEMLFGSGASFTIDDIVSFSWQTNKITTGGSAPDWYLTIYTTPDDESDDASWYGRRLTFEGLYANNFSTPASTWNTYQTGTGTNQVTMYDGNRGGNLGFYGAPTLADIQAGPIDWDQVPGSGVVSSDSIDYGAESVKFIAIETGSGWANGFTGNLDAFSIQVGGSINSTTLVDFEAVPEPSGIALASTALVGAAGYAIRRKRRSAVNAA